MTPVGHPYCGVNYCGECGKTTSMYDMVTGIPFRRSGKEGGIVIIPFKFEREDIDEYFYEEEKSEFWMEINRIFDT
jgi:hypothetical protein